MPKKSKKPGLIFSTPENVQTATAFLTDKLGNIFRLIISGTDKKAVNKFVRDQKKKLDEGKLGISAEVTRLKTSPKLTQNNSRKKIDRKARSELAPTVLKTHGVNIAISRYKMVTPKPYTISYTIDPTIVVRKQGEIVASDPPFSVSFANPQGADVTCDTEKGNVAVELYNAGAFVNSTEVNETESKRLLENQHASDKWEVRVSPAAPTRPVNTFVLHIEKIISEV